MTTIGTATLYDLENRAVALLREYAAAPVSDLLAGQLADIVRDAYVAGEASAPMSCPIATGNRVTIIPDRGPSRMMRVSHVEANVITLVDPEAGND